MFYLGNLADPCQDNESPCLNGGLCLEACVAFSDYKCQCMEGFAGKNCSEQVNFNFNWSCSISQHTQLFLDAWMLHIL